MTALHIFIIAVALGVNSFYIKNYLDNKDDLVGDLDMIKDFVDEDREKEEYGRVFKKILAIFFCIILCYAITFACYPEIACAIGIGIGSISTKKALISIVFSVSDFLGRYTCRFINFKDSAFVYLYSLSRLFLVIGFLLATVREEGIFSSEWYGLVLLIILGFTSGHYTSVSFIIASQRCNAHSKKTAGYLMLMAVLIGMIYGEFISLTCLTETQ